MHYIALALLVFVLAKIAQEDWQERAVNAIWFILLFILLTYIRLEELTVRVFAKQYFINMLFVAVQLLFVNLYFCVRNKKWLWIFDKQLGWGDVVFLLAIGGAWGFIGFITFMIGSLFLILIFSLMFFAKSKQTIPLAGLQALLFIAFYTLEFLDLFSIESLMQNKLIF